MSSKIFLQRFPELAHLPHQEKMQMLAKARYEAFTTLGLSGLAAFYMVVCLLLSFTLAVIPALLSYPKVYCLVSLGVGILIGNYLYQYLYSGLLKRGLKRVL